MAVYRVIYGLILTAALAFSQFYSGHFSSVLLITAAALPIASLIFALIERAAFEIFIDKKEEIIEKGESFRIRIPVRNRFIFPCSSMYLTATVPDPSGEKNAKLVFSLAPLQKKTLKLTFYAKYRGDYEFAAEQLVMYDVLKLFKLKKNINASKRILVTPRIFNVQNEQTALAANDDSRHKTVNTSGGERGFVRKYTDGDDIKHIHWKLSSKHEDYMVWQHSKGQSPEALIICDMTKHGKSAEENTVYTDAVFEAALALCLFNMKMENGSTICCYDKKEGNNRFIPISAPSEMFNGAIAAAEMENYGGEPKFSDIAASLCVDSEKNDGVILITHQANTGLLKLLEAISANSRITLLFIGEIGSNDIQYINGLSNVKFVRIDPNRLPEEISGAIMSVYDTGN